MSECFYCGKGMFTSHPIGSAILCSTCLTSIDVPYWARRADAKRFLVGDVVMYLRSLGAGSDSEPLTISAHRRDGKAIFSRNSWMPISKCTLLRPVDWAPSVGESVVIYDSDSPAALDPIIRICDNVAYLDKIECRQFNINGNIAPSCLAAPLIPFLGRWNREHLRAQEIIKAHQPESRPSENEFSDKGIFATGLTLREASHLDRWTSNYYTPVVCKNGHVGGCMCKRE